MSEAIPQEVERRWLVDARKLPESVRQNKSAHIAQGYLTTQDAPITVRIRLLTYADGTQKALQTIKAPAPAGLEGVLEDEVPMEVARAKALLPICLATLTKTRTYLPKCGELVWEVDEFQGKLQGLVIVELEVPSLAYPVEVPDYFGPEITGLKALSNVGLAFNPNHALAEAYKLLSVTP